MKINRNGKIALGIILAGVLATGGYAYSEMNKEVTPKGYSYSVSGHIVPDIDIKLMPKSSPRLQPAMYRDATGALGKYALGFKHLVDNFKVRENVMTKRPLIEYVSSDKEGVKLQPNGIAAGITFNGRSNLNRMVWDEVTFGLLSSWLNTSEVEKISDLVFGDAVSSDIGFPLAILYVQRQFFEKTLLKDFGAKSGYKPIFADFSYLYGKYIAEGKPFEDKALEKLREKVSHNVVAVTKYLASEQSSGAGSVNEKAVLLLEFYINEDLKIIKSLERDLKMVTPPDNSLKEEKRRARMEAEIRQEQLIQNARDKAARKSPAMQKQIIR